MCQQEQVGLSNAFVAHPCRPRQAHAHACRTFVSDLRCNVIGQYAMGRSLMDRSIQSSSFQVLADAHKIIIVTIWWPNHPYMQLRAEMRRTWLQRVREAGMQGRLWPQLNSTHTWHHLSRMTSATGKRNVAHGMILCVVHFPIASS